MTQADFARAVGVSKSAVTHWKTRGKIPAAAFVERDGQTLVDARAAAEAVKRSIDPGQATGNGAKTRLTFAGEGAFEADPVAERIKAEKLRELEFRNRAAAKREAESSGLYVRADHHRAAVAKVTSLILREIDTAVPEMANALAAATGAPITDLRRGLIAEIRAVRTRIEVELRRMAEGEPETISDEILGADEPVKGKA